MVFTEEHRSYLRSLIESIADTTLKQLGGMGRLRAMIGLKHAMHSNGGKTLILKFPNKAAGTANHVEITLAGDDTYTMDFKRTRGLKVKEVKKLSGVYAEDMRKHFEKYTGLRLSLS